MPLVGTGPRTELLGASVSEPGLHAASTLLVKATLGVLASLTLGATTEAADILAGLRRLRVPDLLEQIMGFMIRYLDVVSAELHRILRDEVPGVLPAQPAALADAGAGAGRAVHPVLRVRRAGAPGDVVARVRGPMSTPVLDVRGLAYAYPDGHQALYGVDLQVRRGERVALLGPNGAGKTTLVLHLNGILTAGAGTVAVSGLAVRKQHLAEIRRRVGVVFQDPDD